VDSPDHQYALLCFYLTRYIRRQSSITGIDLARFQRTSEGTHHSTGGCTNYIVNRRRMRLLQLRRINFVVFGDRPVHAEDNRLGLSGQVGDAKRSLLSFDT
jgi:hypothetical protein